jgi:hypothetical protein
MNYHSACSDSTASGGWREEREGKITWLGGGVADGLARRSTWVCWRERHPTSIAKGEKDKVYRGERERGGVHSPRKVVGLLLVVDMMMVKPTVRVLVAGGGGGERERGEKRSADSRNGG